MENIVDTLFPERPWKSDAGTLDSITLFNEKKLLRVANFLLNRKAPGSDVILAEVLKAVAHV